MLGDISFQKQQAAVRIDWRKIKSSQQTLRMKVSAVDEIKNKAALHVDVWIPLKQLFFFICSIILSSLQTSSCGAEKIFLILLLLLLSAVVRSLKVRKVGVWAANHCSKLFRPSGKIYRWGNKWIMFCRPPRQNVRPRLFLMSVLTPPYFPKTTFISYYTKETCHMNTPTPFERNSHVHHVKVIKIKNNHSLCGLNFGYLWRWTNLTVFPEHHSLCRNWGIKTQKLLKN